MQQGDETITHNEFDEGADKTNTTIDAQKDSPERRDMLMEKNAQLRMLESQQKKSHWYNFGGASRAQAQYDAWFKAAPQNSTDHSTILLNPLHHERVLSYDVAIGVAKIPPSKWEEWRKVAHWRFSTTDSYYKYGVVGGSASGPDENTDTKSGEKIVQQAYPPESMPGLIVDGPRSHHEAFVIRGNPHDEVSA